MSSDSLPRIDVGIVGGGAAGLGAALVLSRARRRVVVFDAGEPRNRMVPHAYGFLGHDGASGADILARGRSELATYGTPIVSTSVMAIKPDGENFVVSTAHGAWEARAIVLATGMTDVLPEIPGLKEIWGTDAAECPYCHGYEVRDRRIVVIGTTDKLPRTAAILTQWSADVTLVSEDARSFDDETRLRLDVSGVRVVDEAVANIVLREGRLAAVQTASGQEIGADAVFVAMRTRATSELAATLCAVDKRGLATVDGDGRTSRAGVWAVGNAADRVAKMLHSAAAGSRAASSINVALFERDLRAKIAARR
jgi:thioredoxin reductase (NADPH)